ncbi:UDP-N-acetylglucosamine--N-acetylmuramyl-(pentapeptide) pyrophosphoryl-undecaprenol N-acetylglucosamine transferase, partial [bacterium]
MRVLAVTGSSGGHIFPALGFLDALKEQKPDIKTLLVLPRNSIKDNLELPYKVAFVSVSNIRPRIDLKNIIALFGFFRACLESFFIILSFRPHIVIGFGSLASLPIIMLAKAFDIKTVIHEQNVLPGRANMLLSKFVDKIAVSFPKTQAYFKDYQNKVVFTGNPMRTSLKKIGLSESLAFFGLTQGAPVILVVGGSQGSSKINNVFLELMRSGLKGRDAQVIHICGNNDYDYLKEEYSKLKITVRLFRFLKDMHYAYSACDLLISRAGATTISEIIFFGVPAVLIPYPFALEHQVSNAQVLKEAGAAKVVLQQDLNVSLLGEAVLSILSDPVLYKRMQSGLKKLFVDNVNGLFI